MRGMCIRPTANARFMSSLPTIPRPPVCLHIYVSSTKELYLLSCPLPLHLANGQSERTQVALGLLTCDYTARLHLFSCHVLMLRWLFFILLSLMDPCPLLVISPGCCSLGVQLHLLCHVVGFPSVIIEGDTAPNNKPEAVAGFVLWEERTCRRGGHLFWPRLQVHITGPRRLLLVLEE